MRRDRRVVPYPHVRLVVAEDLEAVVVAARAAGARGDRRDRSPVRGARRLATVPGPGRHRPAYTDPGARPQPLRWLARRPHRENRARVGPRDHTVELRARDVRL